MAEIRRDGTVEYNGFTGLRNTTVPERFDDGDLNVAQNVDIDDTKRVMRRRGYRVLVAGSYSNIASDDAGNMYALTNAGALQKINVDGTVLSLRTGMNPVLPIAYAGAPNRLYYSNGIQNGVIENGQSRTWGITKPTTYGVATQIGGTLRDGVYTWCWSFVRSDGQLSGNGPIGTIDIETGSNSGGILFTSVPVSTDPGVTGVELYITDVDGEIVYRRGTLLNGATNYYYVAQTLSQVPHRAMHLSPPPIGSVIVYAHGRTFVARGETVYPSAPFSPELFDLRAGIRFETPVTILAPAADGMYVGTDSNVSWHAGRNPEDWVYLRKTNYGAIRGTLSFAPADWFEPKGDGDAAVFMTQFGLVVGQNGGQLVNLTQEKFLFPIQERGTTASRKFRGFNQILAFMQGTETAAASAS